MPRFPTLSFRVLDCLAPAAGLFVFTVCSACTAHLLASDRIRPWAINPWLWEYRDQPVLLLGASKDDKLFQIPDLRNVADQHPDIVAKLRRLHEEHLR